MALRNTALLILLGQFLLPTAPIFLSAAQAQSPDKLLKAHRKVVGAKAASRFPGTWITGSLQSADGRTGRYTLRLLQPDRIRLDLEFDGAVTSECYNGKSAWRQDPTGLRTLLDVEAKRLRLEGLLANGRFSDLRKQGITVRPASGSALPSADAPSPPSEENAPPAAAPAPESPPSDPSAQPPAAAPAPESPPSDLPAQPPAAAPAPESPPSDLPAPLPGQVALDFALGEARTRLTFDADHRLVRQQRQRGEHLQDLEFSDFRAVDKVLHPHQIRLRQSDRDWVIRIDSIRQGRDVTQADFEFPADPNTPSQGDLEALLKAVEANQKQVEELREQYTCRVTEQEQQRTKDGALKSSATRIYEVTPIAGDFVERLVEVDGQPLSAQKQAKVDREVDQKIEKLQRRRDKQQRGEGEDRGLRVGVLEILRISRVTSVRREQLGAQPVLAFDFEPPVRFQPKNRGERLLGKLAGTVWVDEEARQVARLEAHLTGSFKVGGGLVASLGPSSSFLIEQTKFEDGLWLPSRLELGFVARLFLVAGFRGSLVRRYDDYRKYEVQSEVEVNQPESVPEPTSQP